MADTEQDLELNLTQYLEILLRRRWIILLIAAGVFALSAAYAFLKRPVFRATTVVMIEKQQSTAVNLQPTDNEDEQYVNTQFKLLSSDTALQRVYDELKLADTRDFALGLEALKNALKVESVPGTRLCNVSVESTDPALAMKISQGLAENFVEDNLTNMVSMSKDVLGALQQRMATKDPEAVSESLPSVVNSQLIQGIKAQIIATEGALAEARMKYTDSHPVVISLKSRLASMHGVLDKEVGNIVASLKTELSGKLRANNVRIIDLPQLPKKPVRPRRGIALAFGVVGGLALGVFTALLIELLDQTVKTHEDVEQRLELAFLGLIPWARHKKGEPSYAPLVSQELSLTSESFRNLRTAVGFNAPADGEPCLRVTSTVQEEGKSYVSSNLAVVLAQLGQKVLIVDGDLRRPRLHRLLGASTEKGLSDFLSGGVTDPATLVQETEIPNLYVITCGTRPPNPSELLNTERLGMFVSWAKHRYSRVIVDCPPVFPVSDVLLWGHHIKPAIFVSRFGRTRVPLIRTALARLRHHHARILGGVINGARQGSLSYADGRYYEQYYRDYQDTETPKKSRA